MDSIFPIEEDFSANVFKNCKNFKNAIQGYHKEKSNLIGKCKQQKQNILWKRYFSKMFWKVGKSICWVWQILNQDFFSMAKMRVCCIKKIYIINRQ